MLDDQTFNESTDFHRIGMPMGPRAPVSKVCSETRPVSGHRYTPSWSMERGTQRHLMNAAAFASKTGVRLNTTTTINAYRLQQVDEGGVFGVGHLWDGLRGFRELFRHWHRERGIQCAWIWVRENTRRARQGGEHWHLLHHLPKRHHLAFFNQLSAWTGEAHDPALEPRKAGEAARSAHDAWNVSVCARGGRSGPQVAAYLGKDEPNDIVLHGRLKRNPDKLRRRYAGGGGLIEGQRFGLSRSINRAAQECAGFIAPYNAADTPQDGARACRQGKGNPEGQTALRSA